MGRQVKQYLQAKRSLQHSDVYAYRDRKKRKTEFRQLWIIRISAVLRAAGLSYNRFIGGLKKANVTLNRKMLAELALNDAKAFGKLMEIAKDKKHYTRDFNMYVIIVGCGRVGSELAKLLSSRRAQCGGY